MSLRKRMVLFTAAAVAFAVVLSSAACYLAVRGSLRGRLDSQLKEQASLIASAREASTYPLTRPRLKGIPSRPPNARLRRPSLQNQGALALVTSSGHLYKTPGDTTRFSVTARDLAVAGGKAKAYFRNASLGGTAIRVYVAPVGAGRAVIAEHALTDLNNTLHDLAVILIAIAIAGIALAVLLGLFVARTAAKPVHALRQAAEHVRSTGDLSRRIAVRGDDDLGRLGTSFNDMLGSLAKSQQAQRQLVADASHELRTPVATVRTNLEVLQRNPDMPPEDRAPLLRDLIDESVELGMLIEDLLETARESDEAESFEMVVLDELVDEELERWGKRRPGVEVVADLQPTVVLGRDPRLRRAFGNLLDNAMKWSPSGSTVCVVLAGGSLSVRDHGPGFDPADLPHVFDRFYRAPSARTVPGSGLGLSIVRKVAEEHGGVVHAQNAPGGGAIVTVTIPPLETETARHEAAAEALLGGALDAAV